MEFEVKGDKVKIDISLFRGDVSFEPSKGKKLCVQFPDLRKGALEAFIDVSYTEEEGLKVIEKKNGLSLRPQRESNMVLSLPDLPLEGRVILEKGDCVIHDSLEWNGKIEVRLGNLTVKKMLTGELTTKVIKGDLFIEEITGRLKAVTVNGDILIKGGRMTALNCRTVAGDISVTGDFVSQEPMKAVSVSGDVLLQVLHYEGGQEIRALSVGGDAKIEGDVPEEKKKEVKTGPKFAGKKIFSLLKMFERFPFHGGNEETQVEVEKKDVEEEMNVGTVLTMLEERRITAEQAEKLIKALKE